MARDSSIVRWRYLIYVSFIVILSLIFLSTFNTSTASSSSLELSTPLENVGTEVDTAAETPHRRRRRRRRRRSESEPSAVVGEESVPSTTGTGGDNVVFDNVVDTTGGEHFEGAESGSNAVREALIVLRRALADLSTGSDHENTPPTLESSDATAAAKVAFDTFAAHQADILSGKAAPRFVAWRVTAKTNGMGLGNRLLGVISALVLALSTNRALIIVDDPIILAALESVPVGEGGIDMSADAARAIAPTFENAHELAWGLGMDEKCGCSDYLSPPLSDQITLSMETTQYLVPCFAHNVFLRPAIIAAFGKTTAAFRPLMQRFFRLNTPLRDELSRFALVLHPPRMPGAPRRHVIGLQIRAGHLIRPRSEEATFYRCAQQLGALAQLGRSAVTRDSVMTSSSNSDDMSQSLDVIEQALLGAHVSADAVVAATKIVGGADNYPSISHPPPVEIYFFIATDNNDVRDRARSILGRDRVLIYSVPTNAPQGAAAVIDTWALSLCDDVILTYPKSTFGFVGASLSATGLPPHVVISGSKTSSECVRLTSTEPVFHGWFMRWFAGCYTRGGWETGDMLNQDSAYFCLMEPGNTPPSQWGTHVCPASDSADGFLFVQSPFDYEALDELGDSESFFGDAKITKTELMSRFKNPYQSFKHRAGGPIYGIDYETGNAVV
jgi:hypothetical protein